MKRTASGRLSRRRPVKAFIGYKRLPSEAVIKKHLLYNDVTAIRDARLAMSSVVQQLTELFQQLEGEVTKEAILITLQPTFDKSQTYAPVDSGDMKASGYLVVEDGQFGPEGEIGYAPGNEPPYTVYVHERLDLHHKSPTRAKFLQAAMEEDLDSMAGRLEKAYRSAGVVGE